MQTSNLGPVHRHIVAKSNDKSSHQKALYIYHVEATHPSTDANIIASLSNNNILLMSLDDAGLREVRSFEAHKKTITDIEVNLYYNPSLLFTASQDKTVCMWDLRLKSPSVATFTFSDEVNALAVSEAGLLAAGTSSAIHFRDIRSFATNPDNTPSSSSSAAGHSSSSLGEYADTHTDLVTSLEFNSNRKSSILVSGSEDGLAVVYDTSVASNEEAVVSILNLDCPVRRCSFFGPNYEGLVCFTTTEIPSLWHFPSAQRLGVFSSIRENASIDYLLSSFYDQNTDELYLYAGKYSGEGAVLLVEPSSVATASLLEGGHSDMIRSSALLPNSHRLITGGEDGTICVWDLSKSSGGKSIEAPPKKRKTGSL